jgi:hypothetical protein
MHPCRNVDKGFWVRWYVKGVGHSVMDLIYKKFDMLIVPFQTCWFWFFVHHFINQSGEPRSLSHFSTDIGKNVTSKGPPYQCWLGRVLHLSSVSAMLPLIFVTNRVNYSRWLPVYLLDMLSLPPEVVSKFESGNIAIRQKPSAFGCDDTSTRWSFSDGSDLQEAWHAPRNKVEMQISRSGWSPH